MTIRSSRLVAIGSLLAALAIADSAHAEPTAADVETARGLYVEGLELRDAGKLEASLARFKAAHALAATSITSLELGRAHVLLGELIEARDVLLSVERLPVLPSESAKGANARVEARALAEQLRERIPQIRVVFSPKPDPMPAVKIDGTSIPAEALGVPRKLNPGSHTIVAEANGARSSTTVLLVEHESRVVALPPPSPGSPSTPAASNGANDQGASDGPGTWFWIGIGAAGTGVVVGAITGAIAITKADRLDTECLGNACPRSAESDLDTSRTMGVVSTIGFGVAAAGATIAIVAWLTRPTTGTSVRRAPNPLRWTW